MDGFSTAAVGNALVFTSDNEYREKLKEVLVFYMNKMAENERTTILALLNQQGQGDTAEIIRRL